MTRLQIRKRLRTLFTPARAEPEAVELVLVLPDGSERRLRTEPGYTLVMASQGLETPIHTFCPDGHCGRCQVEVLEGAEALRPPSEAERTLLAEHGGGAANLRMACHARIERSGVRVRVRHVWSIDAATRGEPLG